MTTPESSSNPYRSPSPFGDSPSDVASTPRGRRPSGLNAVCIIAMILGGLGLMSSLLGLGSLALRPWMQKTFQVQQQPGMNKEFVNVQRDMQRKTNAVTDRYLGFNWGFSLVNFVLGASLLVGGILVLQLKPKGRAFLAAIFAATIVFELVRIPTYAVMQREIASVVADSMPRMMNAAAAKGGAGADSAAALATTAMKIWTFVVIAFTLIFGLAKVIFYAVGARYLGRPHVRRLFPPAAPPTM